MKLFGTLTLATLMALCFQPKDSRAQTFSLVRSFGIQTNVTGFTPQAPLVQGPDGTLYGTTVTCEGHGFGTVFKIQPDGTGLTALKVFTNSVDGYSPSGALLLNGNTLYGTTRTGGSAAFGNVFKINTDGSGFTVLKSFPNPGPDGLAPVGGLVLSGSTLYGATQNGGSAGGGTVFSVNTDGTSFTVIKNFGSIANDGSSPHGGLVLSGSTLYGTTQGGGTSFDGTIFKINTDGSSYSILKNFTGTDGQAPLAGLLLSGSTLYGTTYFGGAKGVGVVFSIGTSGTGYQVIKSFPGGTDAARSQSALVLGGTTLYGTTTYGGTLGNSGTVFALSTDGSTYQVLKSFGSGPTDGGAPFAGLVLNGATLFGTTSQGGAAGYGTIFKINTDGSSAALLASFGYSDGIGPNGSLLVSGNTLYGTTPFGGTGQSGTVFKVNSDGTGYQVLHSFSIPVNGVNADGVIPTRLGLALSGSTLYGTAQSAGSFGYGTVWSVNTDGSAFTVLKHFSSTGTDGAYPISGLLLNGSTLYGTTTGGGSSQFGTVFTINTDGSGYSVIKGFTGAFNDGATPLANLTLSGSTLYGTTKGGGPSAYGSVFKINTDGSSFSTLKSYNSTGADGLQPVGGLLLIGSTLYGTTFYGGTSGTGTIFKINTDGTSFTVLYNFSAPDIHSANPDGAQPQGTLALNGGALYGTASAGGTNAYGTVFRINPDGTGFTVLYTFSLSANGNNSDGRLPFAGVVFSGNTLYGTTENGGFLDDGTIFALALSATLSPIPLNIQLTGNSAVLTWTNAAFGLQASPVITAIFTNVPSATSPYTNPVTSPQQFFRLLGH